MTDVIGLADEHQAVRELVCLGDRVVPDLGRGDPSADGASGLQGLTFKKCLSSVGYKQRSAYRVLCLTAVWSRPSVSSNQSRVHPNVPRYSYYDARGITIPCPMSIPPVGKAKVSVRTSSLEAWFAAGFLAPTRGMARVDGTKSA